MTEAFAAIPEMNSELARLVEQVCNGTMQSGDWQRLEALLAGNEAAKQYYVSCLDLHAHLQWLRRDQDEQEGRIATGGGDDRSEVAAGIVIPPIDIVTAQPLEQSSSSFLNGNLLLSYAVAALTLSIVLLLAWASRINYPSSEPVRHEVATIHPPNADQWKTSVGRITCALDCRFTETSKKVIEGTNLTQGDLVSLQSGLVEITYAQGSRTILEGPCNFLIDSRDGGYLSRGKLTARIVNKPASERSRATGDGRPYFTVRTPTAIINDLGTEFGIDVEESGASRTHVFVGSVEVLPVNANEKGSRSLRLAKGESVEVVQGGTPILASRGGKQEPPFVRELPQRKILPLHSTGEGLKEGDQDPHWQIVARSDRPKWSPQAAVVSPIDERFFLANQPTHSQWLSINARASALPENATYTFRTRIDLTGFVAQTAILRGRFLSDDHVRAIRINGRNVPVPPHGFGPFFHWTEFEIARGFVPGANVLEIDVLNGGYEGEQPGGQSLMLCRVELEGSAVADWRRTFR